MRPHHNFLHRRRTNRRQHHWRAVLCAGLALCCALPTATSQAAGPLLLAQASSIEVTRPAPDATPEVRVNGKLVKKPAPKGKPSAEKGKEAAKAAGELRVADRQLTVRAARNKDSEFRKVLHPGQPVRVAHLEDGWYAVFDPAEKSGDLSRAWGYSRETYLIPPKDYTGPAYEPEARKSEPGKPEVDKAEARKPEARRAEGSKGNRSAAEDSVGYSVLERKAGKAAAHTVLRVRLDVSQPPATDAMRKIAREIWKVERKKGEDMQLEVLLNGMDDHALAYAVARFHEDGRLREFWWRDVVLGKPKK